MSASARVKYGSAFSPVIPSKSIRNHPFSINNLLNLQDKRNENDADRDLTDTSTTASAPSNASPLEMPPREKQPNKAKATDSSPSTSNLTLNCSFWPPWVYATRYSRQGIPPANFSNPRRARKPIKRQKQRPLFSQEQLQKLEEEFVNEKYISKSRRCKLAMDINLTEAQVRTWFQNRRTRWRKEVHDDCEDDNSWAGSGLTSFGAGVFGANCMVVRGYCSS